MRRRIERIIEAYGDGALSRTARERVERRLRSNPGGEAHLQRTRALGNMIRDACGEAPPVPRPEQIMAVLRPAMRAIDAERASAPRWQRVRDELESWLRPSGAALAGAAAIALLLLVPTLMPTDDAQLGSERLASPAPAAPRSAPFALAKLPVAFENGVARNVGLPQSIYDLAQGETPLMLFEADDGATVIWLLGDAELPGAFATPGGWA